MDLDEKTYVLSENNYIKEETKKTQIVIGHTFNDQMKHFFGWKHRYNGKYKKTAAFTIDAAGFVYKHFEPKFKSDFFNSDDLNDKSIIILLENYGSLSKVVEKNQYITWLGDIYNKPKEVIDKRWRNNKYWDSYTTEQFKKTDIGDSNHDEYYKLVEIYNQLPKTERIKHNLTL